MTLPNGTARAPDAARSWTTQGADAASFAVVLPGGGQAQWLK